MTQAVTLSGLGSTNALYTDSSGNVGIGTSSPASKLHVSKNGSGGDLAQLARFTDTNTANSIGPLHLTIGAANHYAVSPSPVLCGTNGIALGVGDGSDLANQRRLTIDASGNVGIGTSSPSTKLEVKGAGNAEAKISTDSNAYAYLTLNTWALDRAQLRGEAANPGAGSGTGSGALSFWTANNSALAERMRIDSSGNVGIGTSSPSSYGKLSISQPTLVNTSTIREVFIDAQANTATNTAGALSGITFRFNTTSYTSQFNKTSGIYGINTDSGAGGLYGRSAGLVFYTSAVDAVATEAMRIDSSGNLLVGTTSPYSSSHTFSKNPGAGQFTTSILNSKTDNGTATLGLLVKYTGVTPSDGNHIFRCEDSGGTQRFYVQNNGTYGGTSDARLKNNITDSTPKLSDLLNIKVRNFYWNDNENDKNLGFIAQEVEEIFPALIVEDDNGYKTIKHSVFTPMLVKAIQELKAIIDTQNARIEALEAK